MEIDKRKATYSVYEVAQASGIPFSTLRSRVKAYNRTDAPIKFNKEHRIPYSEVLRLLKRPPMQRAASPRPEAIQLLRTALVQDGYTVK